MRQAEKGGDTPEQRSLRVMAYWLFVVCVFSWVIPFTLLFVLKLLEAGGNKWVAMGLALWPSLATFGVAVVLCLIAYVIYRKLIIKA